MMGDRSLPEPTEFVIWIAVSLLAALLGVGSAFLAWAALRNSADSLMAEAAVGLLSAGVAIVGFALDKPIHRIFCVLFAMALLAGYLLGGPEFARLLR